MHEGYLTTLIDELKSRGLAPTAMPSVPSGQVTATHLGRALAQALVVTGDPGLAITYGRRLNVASHGILGYALMSSRNGNQLLSLLSRYAALAVPNLQLRRVLADDRLVLSCEVGDGVLPRRMNSRARGKKYAEAHWMSISENLIYQVLHIRLGFQPQELILQQL